MRGSALLVSLMVAMLSRCAGFARRVALPRPLPRPFVPRSCSGVAALRAQVDDGLNDEQRAAVTEGILPVRVVAGPGSGKTRVLTRRVAWLVSEAKQPPWSILAVTFTNKAAAEMRARVEALLGAQAASEVALGTFHSVCVKLLWRFAERLDALAPGLGQGLAIFDSSDSRRLVDKILLDLKLSGGDVTSRQVLGAFSRLKAAGMWPDDLPNDLGYDDYRDYGMSGAVAKVVLEAYPEYQRRLRAANAADFDDLILLALRLLRSDPEVRVAVGRRWRHVLVDEWQDTNSPQYDLVRTLAVAGQNAAADRVLEQNAAAGPANALAAAPQKPSISLFVVGDMDQSIYGFRGASSLNLQSFEKDYPNCRSHALLRNYRSTANIASAAAGIISRVEGRQARKVEAVQEAGLPIGLAAASTAEQEAAFVAGVAKRYWDGGAGKVAASEMAVMYRTNAQSRAFEEAFVKAGVPHIVVGARRFYERREVKILVGYARVVHYPFDGEALRRIINAPARGIGDKTQEALLAICSNDGGFGTQASGGGGGSGGGTGSGGDGGSVRLSLAPRLIECVLATLPHEELARAALPPPEEAVSAGGGGGGSGSGSVETARAATTPAGAALRLWPCVSVERVAALRPVVEAALPAAKRQKVAEFGLLLLRLRAKAESAPVSSLLMATAAETDLEAWVKAEAAKAVPRGIRRDAAAGAGAAEERWKNVLSLVSAAAGSAQFDRPNAVRTLEASDGVAAVAGSDAGSSESALGEPQSAAIAEAAADAAASSLFYLEKGPNGENRVVDKRPAWPASLEEVLAGEWEPPKDPASSAWPASLEEILAVEAEPSENPKSSTSTSGELSSPSTSASGELFAERSTTALEEFLGHISLMAGADADEEDDSAAAGEGAKAAAAPAGAVRLMTVHASKGLEFDTVFLTGLEEGIFPSARSMNSTEGVDEERRLLYVGVTRAKSRLFMTHRKETVSFGAEGARRRPARPSRFLRDLPERLTRSIQMSEDIKAAGAAAATEKRGYGGGGAGGWRQDRFGESTFGRAGSGGGGGWRREGGDAAVSGGSAGGGTSRKKRHGGSFAQNSYSRENSYRDSDGADGLNFEAFRRQRQASAEASSPHRADAGVEAARRREWGKTLAAAEAAAAKRVNGAKLPPPARPPQPPTQKARPAEPQAAAAAAGSSSGSNSGSSSGSGSNSGSREAAARQAGREARRSAQHAAAPARRAASERPSGGAAAAAVSFKGAARLSVGDSVRHAVHGRGTIVGIEEAFRAAAGAGAGQATRAAALAPQTRSAASASAEPEAIVRFGGPGEGDGYVVRLPAVSGGLTAYRDAPS